MKIPRFYLLSLTRSCNGENRSREYRRTGADLESGFILLGGNMKKVFVVERHGVYQQGTVGIYTDLKIAKEKMREAITIERDDYHHFDLFEMDLNVTQNLNKAGEYKGCNWIQTLRRKDRTVKVENNKEYKPVPAEDSPECGA